MKVIFTRAEVEGMCVDTAKAFFQSDADLEALSVNDKGDLADAENFFEVEVFEVEPEAE